MSLTSYGSSGGTRGLAGPVVAGAGGGPTVVATTGPGGFALQNATPIIFQWTAPSDGQLHIVSLCGSLVVASILTGGGLTAVLSNPADVSPIQAIGPNGSVGSYNLSEEQWWAAQGLLMVPGRTLTLAQAAAVTAGAAILYASLVEL